MISKLVCPISRTLAKNSYFTFSQTYTVKLQQYETHKLDTSILPKESTIEKNDSLRLYKQMELMRKMEVACDVLYKNREIRGFCHLYDGQEAVISGIEDAINKEDCLISAYRIHCHALTRGDTVHQIIAEMLQKQTGSSKGKGGSMHYYRKKTNWFGGNGIVGAQIPVGTGLAFGLKYNKKPNVSVTMYGDGAANQGQVFEAFNMAKLWHLPVIYVCENNLYGMGTSVGRAASNVNFYQRGDTIPGIKVNGNNYFHVKELFKWAKDYAVKNGPLVVECLTYRYHGHSMSDPGISYRTRDQIMEYRNKYDPIKLLKNVILEAKFATEEQLEEISAKAKDEVDHAIEQARKDPIPNESELYTDLFQGNPKYYIRNVNYENSIFPDGKPY